jgi:hypothetical protein
MWGERQEGQANEDGICVPGENGARKSEVCIEAVRASLMIGLIVTIAVFGLEITSPGVGAACLQVREVSKASCGVNATF